MTFYRSVVWWCLMAVWPLAALGQDGTAPYQVAVWARVLFGPEGRATAVEFVDNAGLPPKFLQGARERLEKARIEPRQVQGAAVSFRTGVRMDFEVAPAPQGGTVRLLGLAMLPLPIKRLYADRPANVAQVEGWTGALTASCIVGQDGRCQRVSVRSNVAMPETARRFVKESLELWWFEPQQLAGQPVEGEFETEFALQAALPPPEDFRQDKFERVTKGR
jgi:hypothetical protein